jgi:8-oxo-dGTP pyrophosphatase MutT (NUDIX family)
VFLKNEREEWELPGGKLEMVESPEECLAREMMEEPSVSVDVGSILDSWIYEVRQNTRVFIVTYGCFAEDLSEIRHSTEHEAVGFFGLDDLESLNAPVGYKKSVKTWFRMTDRDFSEQS